MDRNVLSSVVRPIVEIPRPTAIDPRPVPGATRGGDPFLSLEQTEEPHAFAPLRAGSNPLLCEGEGTGSASRPHPIASEALSGIGGALSALLARKPGLTLALLGPDGCGKSTLAADIRDSCALPVEIVRVSLWQNDAERSRRGWLPGLTLAFHLLAVWGEFALGLYYRALGRIVVFDRYTYDALLPLSGKRRVRDRIYVWALSHACPSPDLIVLLDAPGDVMYARKHESTPEQLERQRQGYLALRRRLPRLRVVDATKPRDAVRATVLACIRSYYRVS